VSGESSLPALQGRYDDLLGQLEDVANTHEAWDRDGLRTQIVGLFRDAERHLVEVAEFKDRIRVLVDRFKSLPAPPPPSRVDHLGSTTYLERGWTQIAGGDHEAAVRTLRRALQLAPGEPAVEVMLGWALMRAGDLDEALTLLQRAIASEPANLLARANLGYICLRKGIFGEAVEHLSRVLRTDTDRKATLYANFYMGLLYLDREMYGDAKNFFARTLELGPNLIEAWWELGRACHLDGCDADAARAWRRGAESSRFNPWGERCQDALRALEAGVPVRAA